MLDLEQFPADLRAGLQCLMADMAANGIRRDDPTREIMSMLGDRWTSLILQVLAIGEWRYADLKRALSRLSIEQSISQRILTLKLRALERNGFVARHATADVPPHVSYRLTSLGADLAREGRRLIDWTNIRSLEIARSRAAFDGQAG